MCGVRAGSVPSGERILVSVVPAITWGAGYREDGVWCSEVCGDKIRGGRHERDMGYAMGWGETNHNP